MIDSPLIRNSGSELSPDVVLDRARLLEWLEPFASPGRCGCQRRPWVVVRREDRLELRLATDDAGFRSYAEFREGYVCAGAATENLHLALCHAGFGGAVDLLPDTEDPMLLAVMRPANRTKPSVEEEALFTFLSRPFSVSHPGRHRGTVAPALLALLRHIARQHGTWLDVIADAGRRRRLELLLGEAGAAPTPPLAGEAESPASPEGGNGSAQAGGGFADLIGALGTAVRATPPDTPAVAATDDESRRVSGAPVLLILGTYGDRPLDWLLAGQALQHVLLHASSQGLATTFLNGPLRHAPLRDRIRAIAGQGEPQVIARLDFGGPSGARQYIPALFPVH